MLFYLLLTEVSQNNNYQKATSSIVVEANSISIETGSSSKSLSLFKNKRQQAIEENFVIRTTALERKTFDNDIAKMIYATNSTFQLVENPFFIKMIQSLHPGYKPPSRHQIGGKLLDDVYIETIDKIKTNLSKKSLCMAIDGWSNAHNEPLVCVSVTDMQDGGVYLVDTHDTQHHSHTADYLENIANQSITKIENQFECKILSVVSDNAANMVKMRKNLNMDHEEIIFYGCSAHILNLLARDVKISGIKDHVVQIIKYFKHHHVPSALYKQAGGKCLELPSEVR